MRICLISLPMTVANKDWHMPQVPPLGVAYLAARAREAGHDVTVVDGLGEALGSYHAFVGSSYINGLTIEEMVKRVDPRAKLIGISIMFSKQWPFARRLLAALRDAYPTTPVVVGGEHVSAATQHVFDSSPADYAVIGEGEETLLQLMDALEDPRDVDFTKIDGLAFRAGSVQSPIGRVGAADREPNPGDVETPIVVTASRRRQIDLDAIPWPAWDLIPVRKYIEANRFQDCSENRVMIILGTRGCPYECRFCSSPQMWTTRFNMRDPRDLVDEMESYMRDYDVTEFQFQDLTFVINRRWVLRVAEEICSRKLNITWRLPGGTRSEAFDAEVLSKLSASGCKSLTFAPESGSKRVLEAMLKKTDPERFVHLARIVRRDRIDLTLHAFIIIGAPEETLADLVRTYWFICRLALAGYDGMLCSRFTCYPGSDYHALYRRRGLIEYNDDYFLDLEISFSSLGSGRSWHSRWSARRVKWFVTAAYLLFFAVYYASRPVRIACSVGAVLRNKPRSRIELVFAHSVLGPVRRLWRRLIGGRSAPRAGKPLPA